MESYLEALEHLGRLLDAGVLTKEEFEAEKARLLNSEHKLEDKPVRRRIVTYVILASIVAVLAGAGLTFAVFKITGRTEGQGDVQEQTAAASRPLPTPAESSLSITFSDASKCDPGPSLSDLLQKLRDAATAEEGSDLRLIHLADSAGSVEVERSVQNFGQQQIHLTRLPVSSTWQGLHVTEVRTAEWDEGTGFQLRFQSSPETVLRALQGAGFAIKTVDKSVETGGVFQAIEKSPSGTVLTCMKSNKAGQSTETANQADEAGD